MRAKTEMHFLIYRVEPPRRSRRDAYEAHEYPVGCVAAPSHDEALRACGFMKIRLRGRERLMSVQIHDDESLRQAKAITRERDRTIEDCRSVLDRIKFSVD